jgi:hypothetical protein
MQTTEHRESSAGLIGRFLKGQQTAATVEPRSQPDLLATSARIDRLEEGMRLIAETTKRAYGRLDAALADLRTELGGEAEALTRLTETVERFPLVLAAAVDQLTDELRVTRFHTVEAVGAMVRGREPVISLQDSAALV